MSAIYRLLAALPYFSGLDRADLQVLAQAAHRCTFAGGQMVALEGDPSPGLFVVETGWLKAVKIGLDGREQVLQFIGPGEAFNAVGVFAGERSPASVAALEDVRLWVIPRDEMLRLLEAHPAVAGAVIQSLAGRVLQLIALVEDLSLRTVEARLARLLLERAVEGQVHRQRWATQAEMAARLGTVPDVLNRALRRLVEDGLVEFSRDQVHILDREGLERRAKIE